MSDRPLIDDFTFLTQLIRQIDDNPSEFVSGKDVAAALGYADVDVEPNVRRLMNRGLITWAPGPRRLGDGWTTSDLAVTPEGYRHDGTGLTR